MDEIIDDLEEILLSENSENIMKNQLNIIKKMLII